MAYKIKYKAYAERDIWEIASYLHDHSPEAAKNFLTEVKERIENLTEMPFAHPKIHSHQDYRKIIIGNYVIAYIVNENTHEITIMRVVHGKRNYTAEL